MEKMCDVDEIAHDYTKIYKLCVIHHKIIIIIGIILAQIYLAFYRGHEAPVMLHVAPTKGQRMCGVMFCAGSLVVIADTITVGRAMRYGHVGFVANNAT